MKRKYYDYHLSAYKIDAYHATHILIGLKIRVINSPLKNIELTCSRWKLINSDFAGRICHRGTIWQSLKNWYRPGKSGGCFRFPAAWNFWSKIGDFPTRLKMTDPNRVASRRWSLLFQKCVHRYVIIPARGIRLPLAAISPWDCCLRLLLAIVLISENFQPPGRHLERA